ncbi:hypothetical protein BHU24_05040 [Bacillus pseudomycoides]|nr:acyl carrier protein [Bacillus pseudomycoides]MBD5797255.1 hypothetical protein [Bacillus pseudomycoides]MED1477505.1 acyl carrier protein [Bacillus pseudomycoides]MED1538485.1 acyl carrier protein [Bacillus pseudomycoides]
MSEQNIKEILRNIILEITEVEDLKDDENFVEDLGVDSMMTIEIVARIEKAFKIEVPESYLTQFTDLNQTYISVKEIMMK